MPEAVLDPVHLHSAEAVSELPDNSVGLMVTSPPYHVGKDYDGDGSFEEYLRLTRSAGGQDRGRHAVSEAEPAAPRAGNGGSWSCRR